MEKTEFDSVLDLLRALRTRDLTEAEWTVLRNASVDDPFLSDALEGLESLSIRERRAHLASLERRLEQELSTRNRKRIIPMWRIAAVAAVLLLVAAAIIIPLIGPPGSDQITSVDAPAKDESLQSPSSPQAPEVTDAPSPTASNTLGQSDFDGEPGLVQEEVVSNLEARKTQPARSPIGELESAATTSQKAEETDVNFRADAARPIAPPQQEPIDAIATRRQPPEVDALPEARVMDEKIALTKPQLQAEAGSTVTLRGLVVDDVSGEPLIGADVTIPAFDTGTITDFDGAFEITLDRTNISPGVKNEVIVSYVGFEDQAVHTDFSEPVEVRLQGVVALEEVVTGYSSKKSRQEPEGPVVLDPGRAFAQPKDGIRKYNRYARQNLTYPDAAREVGVSGYVELEFDLDRDGRPTEINIVTSLGYGCDDEAVRLLKMGPAWDVENAQVPKGRVKVFFGKD